MTSSFDASTLGSIVAADYRAAAVLDRHGLDFCCGGKRTLQEACAARGVSTGAIEAELAALGARRPGADSPDNSWAPDELTRYIVRRHHSYVRAQAPVISAHLAKLVSVHGERHPELASAVQHFAALDAELRMHMMKEEELLFPYIRALSVSVEDGREAPPNMFGTVRNPIRMMEAEHLAAGDELATLREITGGFRAPADGCTTYRVCFEELEAFDADLRRHIHLENNVLFPMAVALEARATGAAVIS